MDFRTLVREQGQGVTWCNGDGSQVIITVQCQEYVT